MLDPSDSAFDLITQTGQGQNDHSSCKAEKKDQKNGDQTPSRSAKTIRENRRCCIVDLLGERRTAMFQGGFLSTPKRFVIRRYLRLTYIHRARRVNESH